MRDLDCNCSVAVKLGGLLAATFISNLLRTLDYKLAAYDPSNEPLAPTFDGNRIYVFWHEYILFPLPIWGNRNVTSLISNHRDGDFIARAAHHLGFSAVRGSTTRGSLKALRTLLRNQGQWNLALTPDGPKGPRRSLAAGPIYLASHLQMPLVPVGMGYDHPLRMRSWDRFAIPRPYSRARGVFGKDIEVPHRLNRAGIEHYRKHTETLLNGLTDEAERWAESGRQIVGQWAPTRFRYTHPAAIEPLAESASSSKKPADIVANRAA